MKMASRFLFRNTVVTSCCRSLTSPYFSWVLPKCSQALAARFPWQNVRKSEISTSPNLQSEKENFLPQSSFLRSGIKGLRMLENRRKTKAEQRGLDSAVKILSASGKGRYKEKSIRQIRLAEEISCILIDLLEFQHGQNNKNEMKKNGLVRLPPALLEELEITEVEVTGDLGGAVVWWALPRVDALRGRREELALRGGDGAAAGKLPSEEEVAALGARAAAALARAAPGLQGALARRLRHLRRAVRLTFKRDSPKSEYLRAIHETFSGAEGGHHHQ